MPGVPSMPYWIHIYVKKKEKVFLKNEYQDVIFSSPDG